MKGSWKTTGLGIVTIIFALSDAAKAMLDSDPLTNPAWPVVIAAITAGIGLIMARDNNKSSESVGAK